MRSRSWRRRADRSPRWPVRSGSRSARCGTGSSRSRDANTRADDPDGLSEFEHDELRRLREENVELRTDKEILKRAAADFTGETMRWSASASSRAE